MWYTVYYYHCCFCTITISWHTNVNCDFIFSKMFSVHSSDYEGYCLLWYDAMESGRNIEGYPEDGDRKLHKKHGKFLQ